MMRKITLNVLATAFVATLFWQSSAMAASNRHRATARLFGPTAMKGQAVYEQRPKSGQTFKRFKVELERGLPLQTFNVFVNGSHVGSMTTNGLGRAKFELRTAAFIDSPGDGQPIPSNFPRLDTGDTVTVGPLSGVMFDRNDNHVQKYELEGRLQGNAGVSGKVKYRERFKNGGLLRRFEVEIEDASANQVFDIFVNNRFVGSLTVNSAGRGDFELRTPQFIDSPGDGLPMPSSFPTLEAGDQVRVGIMTTTLQNDDNGGGSGGSGGGNSGGGGHHGGGDD